jgi:hypothetical protein
MVGPLNMEMKNCLKILQTIGVVLIPIVIQISSCQLQKNELQQKYIETAVGILKEKPSIETQGIRSWAIKVFIQYSPIEVDEKTENELRASALPAGKISINPDGKIMFNPDGSATLKPE